MVKFKLTASKLGELCALIFLVAGVGVLLPFVAIAWAGDDNDQVIVSLSKVSNRGQTYVKGIELSSSSSK